MKVQRWRVIFSKTEAMRYTGHLDLILTWERTFRRSGLPLSYSEGYNPRPVITLAAPLPLGFTSTGEIGDFWLSEIAARPSFQDALASALPPGLEIRSCQEIPDLYGNKLPALVRSAIYTMTVPASHSNLSAQVSELLSRKEIIRTRKGKEYDLRPLIEDLAVSTESGPNLPVLRSTLKLLPGASGRPDELLRELGIPVHQTLICRDHILLEDSLPEA